MRNCPKRNCHCQKPNQQIVYPTQENTVHCCSEEVIQHIHPSNTNVVNHHLIKNVHEYPHSTTFANTVNSVDIYGNSFQVPTPFNTEVSDANQSNSPTNQSPTQDPNMTGPTNIQSGNMPMPMPMQPCCPPRRPRRW